MRKDADRIAFQPDAEMRAAIDEEMTEQGLPNRAALVRQAMSHYLTRQKRERLAEEQAKKQVYVNVTGRKIRLNKPAALHPADSNRFHSFESTAARPADDTYESRVWPESGSRTLHHSEMETAGEAYYLFFGETNSKNSPTKTLILRKFYRSYAGLEGTGEDGTWEPGDTLLVQRSVLPWLISELSAAEEAAKKDVAARRQEAQERRVVRPAEAVAQERERREQYVQRYSKEQVAKAVDLASRHEARAARYDQTEHFTWFEWLDHCARTDFRCPTCGAKSALAPHHLIPLSKSGANTIDNIEPVCRPCHGRIEGLVEYTQIWFDEQQELFTRFQTGDLVCRTTYGRDGQNRASCPDTSHSMGRIVRMIPPEYPTGKLWARPTQNGGYRCSSVVYSDYESGEQRHLVPAQAIVHWFRADAPAEEITFPALLSWFDGAAWNTQQQNWLAEQQALFNQFQAGDQVRRRHGPHLGKAVMEIVSLIPPQGAPLWGGDDTGVPGFLPTGSSEQRSEAKARVRWIKEGKTKNATVTAKNLVKHEITPSSR